MIVTIAGRVSSSPISTDSMDPVGCLHLHYDGALAHTVTAPFLMFALIVSVGSWTLALIYYDVYLFVTAFVSNAAFVLFYHMAVTLAWPSIAAVNCDGGSGPINNLFYQFPNPSLVLALFVYVATLGYYRRYGRLHPSRPQLALIVVIPVAVLIVFFLQDLLDILSLVLTLECVLVLVAANDLIATRIASDMRHDANGDVSDVVMRRFFPRT